MSTAHIDRFFAHNRRGELAPLLPNAKEVSESMGAFHAIVTRLCATGALRRADPNTVAIVVGDGHSPRTGALIAMSTAWSVVSVDPVMRPRHATASPRKGLRLTAIADRVENLRPRSFADCDVVLVAVHSHALLDDAVTFVSECRSLHAVAIPCCVPQTIAGMAPTTEYSDEAILSPERRVLVWRDVPVRRRETDAV